MSRGRGWYRERRRGEREERRGRREREKIERGEGGDESE